MLLEPHGAHQLLPLEYDLEVTDKTVENHFIFSEELHILIGVESYTVT